MVGIKKAGAGGVGGAKGLDRFYVLALVTTLVASLLAILNVIIFYMA